MARPLTVHFEAVPPYGDGYETTGSYPQVSGVDGLEKVNTALRNLILEDQELVRRAQPATLQPHETYRGRYFADAKEGKLTANSTLVSVFMPALVEHRGGRGEGYWLTLTMLVPSAKRIYLVDLFGEPYGAVTALAELAKAAVRTSSGPCFADSIDDGYSDKWGQASNYDNFAFNRDGLLIGFTKYQIAPGACGDTSVIIPWERLSPLLNEEGRRLATALAG